MFKINAKPILMALFIGVVMIIGSSNAQACTDPAAVEGQVMYNSTHKTMMFCDGTDWWAMKAGSGGAGIDSTMIQGWPDAIRCMSGSAERILYNAATTATEVFYRQVNTSDITLRYNLANGNYSTQSNMSGYDCVSNSWSITQLYDEGRAFNFIGKGQRNFTCPTGFTMLESQGRTLGCIQDSEEATSGANCQDAAYQCFTAYGGRLPSYNEAYIAVREGLISITNSTGEILDGAHTSSGQRCGLISSDATSNNPGGSVYTDTARAYRCFIPPH